MRNNNNNNSNNIYVLAGQVCENKVELLRQWRLKKECLS